MSSNNPQDLEKHYLALIEAIGEDPNREGLQRTPHRCAKAWHELTCGYDKNLNEIVNDAIFETKMNEMVIVKDIELYSLCEHHMLPFFGKCHVAYIPDGKVLGLSKIARIVDMYARRLQIQEQLTKEIAHAIKEVTGAKGVGVIIEAQHMCMTMRGVGKQNSVMSTSVLLGIIKESDKTRAEFLTLAKG